MNPQKLFVGNLSWDATEDTLKPLFEAHGAVRSVRIIQDPYTGRSRGYGFVEMDNEQSADAAIAQLNEFQFLGRPLRVSKARATERQGGPGGGAGGRGGERRSGGGGGGGRYPSREGGHESRGPRQQRYDEVPEEV